MVVAEEKAFFFKKKKKLETLLKRQTNLHLNSLFTNFAGCLGEAKFSSALSSLLTKISAQSQTLRPFWTEKEKKKVKKKFSQPTTMSTTTALPVRISSCC